MTTTLLHPRNDVYDVAHGEKPTFESRYIVGGQMVIDDGNCYTTPHTPHKREQVKADTVQDASKATRDFYRELRKLEKLAHAAKWSKNAKERAKYRKYREQADKLRAWVEANRDCDTASRKLLEEQRRIMKDKRREARREARELRKLESVAATSANAGARLVFDSYTGKPVAL